MSKQIICKQCGRVCVNAGRGYCKKHYEQILHFGHCLDSIQRTINDPNDIRIFQNYAELDTYTKNNTIQDTFLISLEDVPFASKYKWFSLITKRGVYLESKTAGLFHRAIFNNPKCTIDHINRNTRDNRRENLRLATYTEQNHNKTYVSSRFDVKGIDIHKDPNRKKRYMARFSIGGKLYRSPWYETYEEAVFARSLLEQLGTLVQNTNMTKYIEKLSDKQKEDIIIWFRNRFKDRV